MLEPLQLARRPSRSRSGQPADSQGLSSTGRSGPAAPQRRTRVVLLADDDPVVRQVVRLLIELQGDTVVEAADGPQAVACAAAHAGPIDLLLTDVMMPGLNGPEVCQMIRQVRPGLPTLFISGYFPEAVFPNRQLPAGTAFLSKPFMPEELADALDRLLAGDGEAPPEPRSSERPLAARLPLARKVGSRTNPV
jgi:CheY-like chemotaxis protein